MADMIDDNHKDSRSQLCTFLRDSYLDRTSRPIYALTYLLFFIILYEIGIILTSPATLTQALEQPQIMVVAFVWVQNILEYLGFSARSTWLTTPLVVVVILLALQTTSRTRWAVRFKDFIPMTIECTLLAVPLIVLSLAVNRPAATQPTATAYTHSVAVHTQPASSTTGRLALQPSIPLTVPRCDTPAAFSPGLLVDIITGIGAGIYEELVFRLILICLLMLLFQDVLHVSRTSAVVLSVLISAALFSAHHHIFFVNGTFGTGEIFSLPKFLFRTLAGIYFAVLFAVRGFGITAGTHDFYNIIATVLNTCLFA
jgi:hypothetical protein